ncbi:SDR family NAD(P)-dependent oxidoreductase [Parahaliea mediterranea]|uniref:SDR family oxidoreductase n=1 Tax=Parahaliea mediterranea TaxID=651086 RepID=A0A939DG91_9GAMM|nr:SDR family oxidoreductase [Parahaliea mediterranea]MBN7797499.1 SDR family oxidoreductase [Parahaliea mediterranea]
MSDELNGKFALVSGAASGIGKATSLLLAARGISGIALLDTDAVGLRAVADEIGASAAQSKALVVDVCDDVQLESAFDTAVREFGSLHYVHNNVGVMTGFPPYPDTPLENIDRTIAINLRSIIRATQFACRAIHASGGGSILNTSSGAALRPLPNDPVYSATKAGINALVIACAQLFSAKGVRINAICPGIVDTPILEQNLHPEYAPGTVEEILAARGIKPLQPEDIASAAVNLLVDAQCNGEILSVGN